MTENTEVDQKKVHTLIHLSSQVHAVSPVSDEQISIINEKLEAGRQISLLFRQKKDPILLPVEYFLKK